MGVLDDIGTSISGGVEKIFDTGVEVVEDAFEFEEEIRQDVYDEVVNQTDGVIDVVENEISDFENIIENVAGFDILYSLFGDLNFLKNCKTVLGPNNFICLGVEFWDNFGSIFINMLFSSPILLYIFANIYVLTNGITHFKIR